MGQYYLPIVGSLVAGVLAWLAARKKTSGKISDSDAKDLWAESNAMRKELRDEVTSLRTQLGEAHKEADRLRTRVIELEAKVEALSIKIP